MVERAGGHRTYAFAFAFTFTLGDSILDWRLCPSLLRPYGCGFFRGFPLPVAIWTFCQLRLLEGGLQGVRLTLVQYGSHSGSLRGAERATESRGRGLGKI